MSTLQPGVHVTLAHRHCKHCCRAVLLKWFVVSAMSLMGSEGEEDTYEHIALVLTNVTRRRKGRELLLQPGRGLLQVGTRVVRTQGLASGCRLANSIYLKMNDKPTKCRCCLIMLPF